MSQAEKTAAYKRRRYAEIDAMPKIACACGCGEMIAPISRQLKPRKFVIGRHWSERKQCA
jgi:hypothetical protein